MCCAPISCIYLPHHWHNVKGRFWPSANHKLLQEVFNYMFLLLNIYCTIMRAMTSNHVIITSLKTLTESERHFVAKCMHTAKPNFRKNDTGFESIRHINGLFQFTDSNSDPDCNPFHVLDSWYGNMKLTLCNVKSSAYHNVAIWFAVKIGIRIR